MSVLIAGRCGALAVLTASSFFGAGAQQKMPPTLRERAAKEGYVRTGAIVDYTCCADLTDLVKRSDIIVRGEVTDSKARLSGDERQVWTDYTINIQEVYKQAGNGSFVPGGKIQVATLGGHLLVDGHPVEYDVSPPIPKSVVELFFISTCTSIHCAGPYLFVGGDGIISLDNGQVACSAKPDGIQRPYCGMPADGFRSVVKEKVASLLMQESSFPVHHDGNWLLETCKSELDAYSSGECYGYIYATMDEFHVRPSSPPGSGAEFFCIPERTSPSDWKKTVVDFLVRYPENRTKYQAVELIGMALCSSWPFAHLGAAEAVNLQYRQTSFPLIEADRDLAQTEQLNLERLDAKQKRFPDYAKDFVVLAEFAHYHSDTLEVKVASELNKIAAENDERIGAMITLLTIHENVHCKDDSAGITPLLRFDFDKYGKNIDLDIKTVNLRISSTQSQGVAAEAARMRDDLSEIRSILDSIKLESPVRVIPDGNWLLQTCKSEDAYGSGECYGYIYATMDRFYWENGGAGTPFFCFPKPTSPSDLKKTVVDFLVQSRVDGHPNLYSEERTKYKAVELIGLAISSHWPCGW